MKKQTKKNIIRKIGTGLALSALAIGSFIYYINPNKKPTLEDNPFFYENQIYHLENRVIKKENQQLNIPANNITDFAIKDNVIYFNDYNNWNNVLKKVSTNLEEIVTITNKDEYCIEIDIQNNELLKKIEFNEGEYTNYYLGDKIINNLKGDKPFFVGDKVYSLGDKNIFMQNIKNIDNDEINLCEPIKITDKADYLEFRILNNSIYSLNGSDYTGCDLYSATLNNPKNKNRITYDNLNILSHKKMKKDLIIYTKNDKDYAAFSQGSREKIAKINNIYLGEKNEK